MSKFDNTNGTQTVPAYVSAPIPGLASGTSTMSVDLLEYRSATLSVTIGTMPVDVMGIGIEESDDDSIWTPVSFDDLIVDAAAVDPGQPYVIVLDGQLFNCVIGYIGFKRYIRMIYLNGVASNPLWAAFLLERVSTSSKALPQA